MKIALADRLMLFVLILTLLVSGLYYYFKVMPTRADLDENTHYTVAEIYNTYKPNKHEWTFGYVYSVNEAYYTGTGTIPLTNDKEYRIGRKVMIRFSCKHNNNSEPLYHFVSDTLTAPRSGWKELPDFLLEKQ